MKISLPQTSLSRIASHAGNIVPGKSTLPILSCMLLKADKEGLTLSATDLDISISIRVDMDVEGVGEVAIPAKKFSEIVRKLDDLDTTLEMDGSTMMLSCGKSRFRIPTMDAADFPKMPSAKGLDTFTAPVAAFRDMIRQTRYAASTDLARPSMNGVLMDISAEKVTMVATDGHRLAHFSRADKLDIKETYSIIMPSKALDQLIRLLPEDGDLEIGFTENQAFFRSGENSLFTRLVEGPYPNYKQVIPQGNAITAVMDRDAAIRATDRVSTMATNLSTRQVKLSFKEDQIGFAVSSSEGGQGSEEITAAYSGDVMDIGYNSTYLLDALKNMHAEQIQLELDKPDNAGILRPSEQEDGEDYFCLLMPLKLSE